jgi:hypothetical protein
MASIEDTLNSIEDLHTIMNSPNSDGTQADSSGTGKCKAAIFNMFY